ncbi:MAG: hypothetical protein J7L42_06465, partial [Elusimicrobia bacterium]|nr:hypothetical protein [Elusimicrobiota bacterium]
MLLFLVLFFSAICYFYNYNLSDVGCFNDDSYYILSAKKFAGKLPDTIWLKTRSLGWPLLLTPWAFFLKDLETFKIPAIAFYLLCVFYFYALFRKKCPEEKLFPIILIFSTAPSVISYSTT